MQNIKTIIPNMLKTKWGGDEKPTIISFDKNGKK